MDEVLPIPTGREGIIWLHNGNHYDHPRHRHAAMELNIVVAGRGTYEVDGRRHPLIAGSALWIRPGEEHYLEERTPDFSMWIVAATPLLLETTFTTHESRRLLREHPKHGLTRLLFSDDLRWLDREIRRLSSTDSLDFFRTGVAYTLMAAWESTSRGSSPDQGNVLSGPLQQAIATLEENPHLSREDLADTVRVSPERLGRLFQGEFSVSFSSYRNRLRVQRFFEIHRQQRTTMLGACLEAGFGSYAQFHRVFTAEVGLSPRHYFGQRGSWATAEAVGHLGAGRDRPRAEAPRAERCP